VSEERLTSTGTPTFGVDVEQRGHTRTIRLQGEFDLHTKRELESRLRELPLHRLEELTLDLRGLTFVDSSGLRVLLECWNSSNRYGFELAILMPGGQVREAIETAGLSNVLPIAEPAGEGRNPVS
jgi:anti-sigma B factor antagonist